MKRGRKTAVKLFDEADIVLAMKAMDEANLKDIKKPYYLEQCLGQKIRCEGYCNAKDFCHQYKREHDNGGAS